MMTAMVYAGFACFFFALCAAIERFIMPRCHRLNAWLASFED